MNWKTLKLWAEDEETRLLTCITKALQRLIQNEQFNAEDGELIISGKFRKHLYQVKKEMKLAWQLNCEVSSFEAEEDPIASGHPDFRFSNNTPDYTQYDYDIECKLVRIKRKGKTHNYCRYYVTDGIKRFQTGIYAQSIPPMGTMIAYVQEGDILALLDTINQNIRTQNLHPIQIDATYKVQEISQFTQKLQRNNDEFILMHLWVDLR